MIGCEFNPEYHKLIRKRTAQQWIALAMTWLTLLRLANHAD